MKEDQDPDDHAPEFYGANDGWTDIAEMARFMLGVRGAVGYEDPEPKAKKRSRGK